MSAHPIPENAHCWWLVCGKWRRLHAVPGREITVGQIRDATDEGRPVPRRAVCGLRRGWWLPGLYSRLGRRRCRACCHALAIAPGYGTPANEADRKD